MATSLKNLAADNKLKFQEALKVFSIADIDIVTRKRFYPYEYTDSWKNLNEPNLPPKKDFYSLLTEKHISDTDYKYAKYVWNLTKL